MIKKERLIKTFALGVVVLFIGTGVVSAFNVNLTNESNTTIRINKMATMDNHPPNAPNIKGKAFVRPAKPYSYTFNATDPDGDNVFYEIDWGDGNSEKWIGPYASGKEVILIHTYYQKLMSHIRARANDTHGAIGDWGVLNVWTSKNKQIINPAFLHFIEQFKNVFQILRFTKLVYGSI